VFHSSAVIQHLAVLMLSVQLSTTALSMQHLDNRTAASSRINLLFVMNIHQQISFYRGNIHRRRQSRGSAGFKPEAPTNAELL